MSQENEELGKNSQSNRCERDSEHDEDKIKDDYENIDEDQLKKEIKATKRRLLELIMRKNQLIVQKIKEKQAQEQQLNANNQNNPQNPSFGQINPFFFPGSFKSHHRHKDNKHKHHKKHSSNSPPFFEILQQIQKKQQQQQQLQQQNPQQQQSDYPPYAQSNYGFQFGQINQNQQEQIQPFPNNLQNKPNFGPNPYGYPSQLPQYYQSRQSNEQCPFPQQFFYPYDQIQGQPLLLPPKKNKKGKNSKKASEENQLIPPPWFLWQQSPYIQQNRPSQFEPNQPQHQNEEKNQQKKKDEEAKSDKNKEESSNEPEKNNDESQQYNYYYYFNQGNLY